MEAAPARVPPGAPLYPVPPAIPRRRRRPWVVAAGVASVLASVVVALSVTSDGPDLASPETVQARAREAESVPAPAPPSATVSVPAQRITALRPAETPGDTRDTNGQDETPQDGLAAPADKPIRRGSLAVPDRKASTVARPVERDAFDDDQARVAVWNASRNATICGIANEGTARVVVTFAPSGRVTRALIEQGPLQGTLTGSCVARQLRSARVAPFSGSHERIAMDVVLP